MEDTGGVSIPRKRYELCNTYLYIQHRQINIEGKAHAGNATQNTRPLLMQKAHIHIHEQPHTLHHLYIY